jgi:hypothetical protein
MILRFSANLTFILFLAFAGMFSAAGQVQQSTDNRIQIRGGKYTVFNLLNEISRQTGIYFIYDSGLINNEQVIRVSRNIYSSDEILQFIIKDPDLTVSYVENYAIIHKVHKEAENEVITAAFVEKNIPDSVWVRISGRIADAETAEGMPYASVIINGRGMGISANADGIFNLRIPYEFFNDTIKISYLGYSSRYIPIRLFPNGRLEIVMQPEAISLQEFVFSSYNPYEILMRAIERRNRLYPQRPVIHQSFYRESIFRNDDLLNYSEAVFDIYKSAYRLNAYDQVRLLKSRRITDTGNFDSLSIKLRAGIQSMLELDVVKNPPDFLIPEMLNRYKFPDARIIPFDEGTAYCIVFKGADHIADPVYEGVIYIDTKSMAILQVDFNITQTYLRSNQHHFITRRSKMHNSRIRSMKYTVRYAPYEGFYHIQFVRGEIGMRIREKNKLRGNNYSAFFEMAVMNIDNEDVRRFSRRETLRTGVIFSDQNFEYDQAFWEGFNFIIPENRIIQAFSTFNAGLEQTDEDDD